MHLQSIHPSNIIVNIINNIIHQSSPISLALRSTTPPLTPLIFTPPSLPIPLLTCCSQRSLNTKGFLLLPAASLHSQAGRLICMDIARVAGRCYWSRSRRLRMDHTTATETTRSVQYSMCTIRSASMVVIICTVVHATAAPLDRKLIVRANSRSWGRHRNRNSAAIMIATATETAGGIELRMCTVCCASMVVVVFAIIDPASAPIDGEGVIDALWCWCWWRWGCDWTTRR